jgi:cellulose synthase/poly-beta-1,6-N-acetylglucosamine synthase-like glycosyltransferase
MSLGTEPIVSNILFTLSLLPHVAPADRAGSSLAVANVALPFVSIIVALYQEPAADIDLTMASLRHQRYPVDRYEILVALEPDDDAVPHRVSGWLSEFTRLGVPSRIVLSDGVGRMKARALNHALAEAQGEYCAFYDAGDHIDRDQVMTAIRLMEAHGADVGQARVLRAGRSLLSRLLLLDTCVWHFKYLPVLQRLCGGFPLSGEGLFIRTTVLRDVSGFPEVLTEDGLLGLMLTARHKRFTQIDSTVIEKAPRNVLAHFRQKLRWHRGYLTCLRRLGASEMPMRKKLVLALPFSVPITSALAFLGWLLICARLIVGYAWHDAGPNAVMPGYDLYTSSLYYWSLALVSIGIPIVIASGIHALWCAGMIRYAPVALCLPLYWMFVGACAVSSLFRGTAHWGKTER